MRFNYSVRSKITKTTDGKKIATAVASATVGACKADTGSGDKSSDWLATLKKYCYDVIKFHGNWSASRTYTDLNTDAVKIDDGLDTKTNATGSYGADITCTFKIIDTSNVAFTHMAKYNSVTFHTTSYANLKSDCLSAFEKIFGEQADNRDMDNVVLINAVIRLV